MTPKPTKRNRESILAYYLRVSEWETLARKEAAIESRVADRLALRSTYQTQRAVTAQTMQNRRSLHELAENNPLLRNVLRRLQK